MNAVAFDLSGGSNTLTQLAQPSAALTYNAGTGSNTLNVNGGTYTFNGDPAIASGELTVNDNSSVVFSAAPAGAGYTARNLYSLNVTGTATAAIVASATATDRIVLATSQLAIAGGATLDLANNAMIVHGGNLSTITSLVQSGCNNGLWNGTGIMSSSAAADPAHLTAIGAISNDNAGTALYSTFDNQPVGLTDVLLKDTYYGDANLDGKVDGSDYSRIDSAYLTPATGWFNGDFNYDGVIDGSDYTLIDNAFNTQGANLAASISPPANIAAEVQSPLPTRISLAPSSKAPGKSRPQSQTLPPNIFSTAAPIAFAQSTGQTMEMVLRQKDLLDGLISAD